MNKVTHYFKYECPREKKGDNYTESDELVTCELCKYMMGQDKQEYVGITVTVHVSPDCKPETLQALAEMMKLLIKQMDDKADPNQRPDPTPNLETI